jgi:hypothetical protein
MPIDDIRVGLLAYGAIGYEHNLAVENMLGDSLQSCGVIWGI